MSSRGSGANAASRQSMTASGGAVKARQLVCLHAPPEHHRCSHLGWDSSNLSQRTTSYISNIWTPNTITDHSPTNANQQRFYNRPISTHSWPSFLTTWPPQKTWCVWQQYRLKLCEVLEAGMQDC